MASRLLRNLRPGDRFRITGVAGQSAVVTTVRVDKIGRGYFSGDMQYAVVVAEDLPFWFPRITGYSDTVIDLVSGRNPLGIVGSATSTHYSDGSPRPFDPRFRR